VTGGRHQAWCGDPEHAEYQAECASEARTVGGVTLWLAETGPQRPPSVIVDGVPGARVPLDDAAELQAAIADLLKLGGAA
jgi:hypothetical protein